MFNRKDPPGYVGLNGYVTRWDAQPSNSGVPRGPPVCGFVVGYKRNAPRSTSDTNKYSSNQNHLIHPRTNRENLLRYRLLRGGMCPRVSCSSTVPTQLAINQTSRFLSQWSLSSPSRSAEFPSDDFERFPGVTRQPANGTTRTLRRGHEFFATALDRQTCCTA